MAQVVIFAPPGEDVSAGEQALKDAGHEVEVVEASAENLLHMAIGMLESGEPAEEETEEPAPEEDPLEGEAEEPTEDAAEEDPKKMESLGYCAIDGENIKALRGKKTRLFVSELHRGEKTTFSINESTISIWESKHRFFLTTPKGEMAGATAPVYRSKFGQSYLVVGPEISQFF